LDRDKLELRVRGPNVTPGYWRDPELTAAAFDEHGFYRIGDAGKLADRERPELGIVFDGRVSEDFKLDSGTWVHVGKLRAEAIAACEPLVSDCVVTGHDRAAIGLLLFVNLAACRRLAELDDDASPEQVVGHPRVRQAVAAGLFEHNRAHPQTSARFTRAWIEREPPSIDADEITDKGYINQRAVLSQRAESVARLYREDPGVITPNPAPGRD
jgi:feruloyl-CoA synthase